MDKYLSKKQKLDLLEAQLREERITFRSYWTELSNYILPRRSRFFISDVNSGERKNTDIIDSTATVAARTLSSGMMSGITSPARSWFKLRTNDDQLNESFAVKEYFKDVEDRMRSGFLKTNLYNQLPVLYGDLGTFATAALYMEEDVDDIANFYCFPIGSYMIANDRKGRVRVFFREFQMSVRQIVEKFGQDNISGSKIDWSNISQAVKDSYDRGQYEQMIDVNHFILPNENYKIGSVESKYKKYISLYYERGFSDSTNNQSTSMAYPDKFLSEKGYDYFPVMVVRWEVAGEDTYGTNSPGMVCLGDVKQLQLGEKRIAQALDQKVAPSMIGPTNLKRANASLIAGDITYLDEKEGTKGFRRLFEIDFDIRELEGKQAQLRDRISKAYFEDLFLMLANSDRRQITATEISERREEKLLALGPVLERINQDLLDPLIENMFSIMDSQGLLPEPPEELAGKDYTIEYVSVMAQAQKLAGIGNIERFLGFVGQVAGLNPEAVMKINIEQAIEDYADKVGVDPSILISKEQMEEMRQAQAQAQAAEQEAIAAQQAVEAGKTLSETQVGGDTALAEILGGSGA